MPPFIQVFPVTTCMYFSSLPCIPYAHLLDYNWPTLMTTWHITIPFSYSAAWNMAGPQNSWGMSIHETENMFLASATSAASTIQYLNYVWSSKSCFELSSFLIYHANACLFLHLSMFEKSKCDLKSVKCGKNPETFLPLKWSTRLWNYTTWVWKCMSFLVWNSSCLIQLQAQF